MQEVGTSMFQQITIEPTLDMLDQSQIDRHKGTDSHQRLIENIKQYGILQPPGIRPNNKVIWGTGRVLASILLGLKQIPAVMVDKPMTESEYLALRLSENLIRLDLTPREEVEGIKQFQILNSTMSNKEISDRLSICQ